MRGVMIGLALAAAGCGVAQAQEPAPAQAIALPKPLASRALVLEAQVLLDRANFAPGVIDGRMGSNVRGAAAAWQAAHGQAATGAVTPALVQALRRDDPRPVLTRVAIQPEDANGPFAPETKPEDYAALAKLERTAFHSAREAVAERHHVDEAFLAALNPGVDFGQAGREIVVPAVGRTKLARTVARIEVEKAKEQVRAFDGAGELLAVYPATVGSGDNPTPSGTWEVRTVAPAPDWTYDPARLKFGDKSQGKLTIKPGPNNPVGVTWIDLSKDTYGIHGTPHPRLVGKRASHGCVRLTNWDAWQLGQSVEAGTKVVFVG